MRASARQLRYADLVLGIAAGLLLVVGMLRVRFFAALMARGIGQIPV